MEKIIIPGLDAYIRRQSRAYRACGYKPEDDDEQERHQVLAGLGTAYLKPHIYKGKLEMFWPGAFAPSLASGRLVNLQLDHDGQMVVASTATGLELRETDIGLLFRLDMRRVRNASAINRIVDAGNRAAASVAYVVRKDHTETFGGHAVRVIDEADLQEISLVRRGAVGQAFAFLSDTINTPSIVGMENSAIFVIDQMNHNIKRSTETQLETVALLTARVDRLCERAGIKATTTTGMSREANDVLVGLDKIVKGLEALRV